MRRYQRSLASSFEWRRLVPVHASGGNPASHEGMCAVTAARGASAQLCLCVNTMVRPNTAVPYTRILSGLLIVVLLLAVLPSCATACCEAMHAKGTLATAAPRCFGPCEDRTRTVSTAPRNIPSDAGWTPTVISTATAIAADLEHPAGLGFLQDEQPSAATASLAIYLRNRSLLI